MLANGKTSQISPIRTPIGQLSFAKMFVPYDVCQLSAYFISLVAGIKICMKTATILQTQYRYAHEKKRIFCGIARLVEAAKKHGCTTLHA